MEPRRRSSRPKRRPAGQQLKNTVLYCLMRTGVFALQHLPLRWFIRLLGCLSPYLFRREARRAEAQLRRTLPDLDAPKVTRRMFVHFAESVWELTRLRASVPPLDPEVRRLIEATLQEEKGAIVICGHVGNWELLGHAVAAAGYPVTTVAKPLYDPRVTRWMHQWRTQLGMNVLWRDGNTGKAILRALRQNQLLAFLIDQDTRTAGEYVPFFGRPAFTPTTPAALALRTGAPIIFIWHQRRGKKHRIQAERLHFEAGGDRQKDVVALTALLTTRLESVIREAPEQWVWMHKRWRTRRRLFLQGRRRKGAKRSPA